MSQSELQRLSADMESDAALRARMEAADPDARAAAARSAGYEIDDSDLETLSDADLDDVAGGGGPPPGVTIQPFQSSSKKADGNTLDRFTLTPPKTK